MARRGRANEVVVADAEASPRLFVQRRDLVDERLWILSGAGRVLLDLQPVLIGAGHEVDGVAQQAVPPRQRVSDDGGVGVP